MQNKTLLAKIVGLVAVVCLALAMTFGLVACGDATVKNITQDGNVITVELTDGKTSEIKLDGVKDAKVENGKLVLTYADGKTAEFALDVADLSTGVNEDGDTEIVLTFNNGRMSKITLGKVVADAAFEDGAFTVTYSDGTTAEYAIGTVVDVEVLADGQTKITYADGTEAVIGEANCDHAFTASADIKPASCCEKGVAIQVCEKCGFVESIEVDKDPTVHGKWELTSEIEHGALNYDVNEETGIIYYSREDKGFSLYTLATEYICDSVTILEGYSGVADLCFKAQCALCGEQFAAGHAPVDEWENIIVDDDLVNVCENEHTVYKTCPICKSVLLYDDNGVIVTEKEPALGHIYGEPLIGNKVTNVQNPYYPVTLTCERCGADQEVRAYFDSDVEEDVPADCRNDGHYMYQATYKYAYNNYVDGEATILYGTFTCEDEYEVYENTGEHTLADDVRKFHAYSIVDEGPEYEYTEDLKAFFDNNKLRWSEGVPANCETHNPAVFTCTVCGEQIVIALSGEHTFGDETVIAATCTEDGYSYKTCADCDYRWVYNEVPAKGHNYAYVNGSFEASTGKANFRCANCGDVQNLAVTLVSHNPAQDCKSKTYDTYKVVIGTQTIQFNVVAAEEVLYHTIKANTATEQYMKYAAYSIANDAPKYEYNEQLKGFFAQNLIRWSEGVPANCSTYMPAVFTCTVCNEQIVIALSGEHLGLDEEDTEYDAPTCTERGFLYMYCADCEEYILQNTYAAVGHSFAPNADSWEEFLAANVKAGKAVVFDCADCDTSITLYAKETITPSTVGCVTTDTYKYDFYTAANNTTNYTYQVETAEGTAKTLTFKYSWAYSESQGTHLIGKYNGNDVRVVAFNLAVPADNRYEYGEGFGYFFGNGKLAWNEGNPGTCDNGYALAVFTCETCGEKVVFQLSGEHTLGDTITEEPDCTHAGRSYKVCQICQAIVDEVVIPALGHDYGEWTVEGDRFVDAYEEEGVVYVGDYNLGYAISVCTRCQDELEAEADVISTTLPTCGKDGKVVVGYYFDDELVATDTIVIPMIDHHITTLENAEHVIKWFDDGKYYLGYVCDDCGKLVVVAKSANEATIDALVEELTADYVDELMGRA